MPDFVVEFGKTGRPPESDGRLDAPAFHRNHQPIWSVLGKFLGGKTGDALEVGSGTGQHVVSFAAKSPGIVWWPSDHNDKHLQSIAAWRSYSQLANVRAPMRIDLMESDWAATDPTHVADSFVAMLCINVLHIAPWRVSGSLLACAARYLRPDGRMFVYGPFMRDGVHTAASNAAFDASLRGNDPNWGVRDTRDLAALAQRVGLRLDDIIDMPANNFVLVFRPAVRGRVSLSQSNADLPGTASRPSNDTAGVRGEGAGSGVIFSFDFDDPAAERDDAVVTAGQFFRSDFVRERDRVQSWFAQQGWLPDTQPELRVIVSTEFRISKSLVPAWYGQRGRMEFPTSRVAAGRAAIAHELTHVYFPNANRFLAEGLALYVQAEIGSNPAFPNFGKPLHELALEILADILPDFHPNRGNSVASLAPLHLTDLDVIATPNPLTLTAGADFYGEEARGQRVVYAIAGSFAAFLIATRGLNKFRDLYVRTPFRPQLSDAGMPDRWRDVYGRSLTELEGEWKRMIAGYDHATAMR